MFNHDGSEVEVKIKKAVYRWGKIMSFHSILLKYNKGLSMRAGINEGVG